ncbi:MAG: nuclear transport factor 2 family protein [Sphingomonadales bacterium]|nr:nuclear transport factor 2 family protein [Sphingomonadales bacterium]
MGIEERLQRLEDDRAIRDLKARYLRACDSKDPESVRDCLLPTGAVIAYDGFPPFDNRDDFVAIYSQMGCAGDIRYPPWCERHRDFRKRYPRDGAVVAILS